MSEERIQNWIKLFRRYDNVYQGWHGQLRIGGDEPEELALLLEELERLREPCIECGGTTGRDCE